ncbi:fused MFS/spermidine synthase [Nocardioides sp.]|uniref:spermidine synthase n=1 Tax=Nocardioides sp. TaxID=35761 RepID=UPI002B277CBF|nr:fused MFS/spermidine synthase [Nocardioides sp.]
MLEILAEGGPESYVVRVGGRDQSFVDLADPTRLVFDYVRRIGDVLDAVAPDGVPIRVVHVGGAGLTLPRYVATTRPTSAQVVLEPDEALTERVREVLPLPRRSGIKVRATDGARGIAALRDDFADVVVVDAFRDGEVPSELLDVAHLADVARVLAPGGCYLLNLADAAPFTLARDTVAGLREVFGSLVVSAEPATLKGRRAGNLLITAGRDAVPLAALRRRAASSPAPYQVLDDRGVSDRFGGGRPRRGITTATS